MTLYRNHMSRSGGHVVVTDLPEAGMRCVLLVGDVRQKALLADNEVAVGFNALEIDDDDKCGVGGLRTMWVERRSLRCVDGEYEGDFPIMATDRFLHFGGCVLCAATMGSRSPDDI